MKKKTVKKNFVKRSLEEHIVKLIEAIEKKKVVKKTIEAIVKKKKVKAEEKTSKEKKAKDVVYRRWARTEYSALEKASVYAQVKIDPFVGFVYKSNVRDNNEFYAHLESEILVESAGERNLASDTVMENYARKMTLNFLFMSDVNDVSVEEKETMTFNLYDVTQKAVYLAKVRLLGFAPALEAPPVENKGFQ